MNTIKLTLLLGALVLAVPGIASAEVLRLAPVQSAVLPAGESELTPVALKFSLAGIPEGVRLDDVYLEWTVSEVPEETYSMFAAHRITGSWTAGGQEAVVFEEEPVALWDIAPPDLERSGGLVRLDLRALARDWVGGTVDNHGIVVVTDSVARADMLGQDDNARLVIRYGR